MNPLKALADRFRTPAHAATPPVDEWEKFVDESIAEARPPAGKTPETVRFRCAQCQRGLRVPEEVIGRKIACPFCRTVFLTSFENDVEIEPAAAAPAPAPSSLTKWLPKLPAPAAAATQKVSDALRADARVKAAKATILSTASAAASAVAPLATIAAGAASIALPGSGEVLTGRPRWGFCTMAAFLGATAAASAAGGAWIALPIALRVFSAYGAVNGAEKAGRSVKEMLTANAQAANSIAQQLTDDAARMDDEAFEREMQAKEAEELRRLDAERARRRVVLTRVGTA